VRHVRRPRRRPSTEDHRRVRVDDCRATRQLAKRAALAGRLDSETGHSARTQQPPPKHGQRSHGQLDAGRLQALGQLAALGQHRRRLPPALAQTAGERSQLQVRAVEAGGRVQEEDPVRNRFRRAA
jgi:hypothetical protein